MEPASTPDPAWPRDALRRVDSSDWERYRELRLRSLAADPLAFGSTLDRELAFPPETWKHRLSASDGSERSASWVALGPDGEFVGTITCAAVDNVPHLFAMWVAPEHRRQGHGSQLLDAALAWARARFPDRPVLLEVNPRQSGAVRLYGSRGFRATGRSSALEHAPSERVVEMVRDPLPTPD